MKKRAVITGLGVISSLGTGEEFWKNIVAGKSGIKKISFFDTTSHFSKYGGEIRNFKKEKFISKSRLKFTGRTSALAIAAAKLALKNAGIETAYLSQSNAAICLGTTSAEVQIIEQIDKIWVDKGVSRIPKQLINNYNTSNIMSNLAQELAFTGITRVFGNACAAGNYAISYAHDLIKNSRADIIIAGGADSFSESVFSGFNQLGAVAPRFCQPFDKNRKGMIPAEGAGIVIVESLEHALKRKADIYAEILGYGINCDAFHITSPDFFGIKNCIKLALKNSKLVPEQIDYICAHGTGTKSNDSVEAQAINAIFPKIKNKIPVSSIKSMLGHSMGASSAIEAISCCLTIKNSLIPPTINFKTNDPECDIDCVHNVARKQKVNIALNNSFAFGGNNLSLVLSKIKI